MLPATSFHTSGTLVSYVKWHPMIRRATSARPYPKELLETIHIPEDLTEIRAYVRWEAGPYLCIFLSLSMSCVSLTA